MLNVVLRVGRRSHRTFSIKFFDDASEFSVNSCCFYFLFKVNVNFWAFVCKTVRPMLSDRCLSVLSCLSVCDVGVLWPNGLMDQDEAWHAGRPRPWPHCVR